MVTLYAYVSTLGKMSTVKPACNDGLHYRKVIKAGILVHPFSQYDTLYSLLHYITLHHILQVNLLADCKQFRLRLEL